MKRLILVDANNWGFAGMANPRLSAGEKDTQATNSVLKKLHHLVDDHPDAMIMFLWDGRSWRKDVTADYKANRTATEKQVAAKNAYVEQKKDIQLALKLLGISQVSSANMEADDLAYILTKNAIAKRTPVTLLTADHDWQQLVQPGVVWVNSIHDQSCRHSTFRRDTGYKDAAQFVDAKCVLGDTGDNVKGIYGVGERALEALYKYYDSFEAFLAFTEGKWGMAGAIDHWLAHEGKKMPKKLREIDVAAARKVMALNRTLMDLATPNRPKPEKIINIRQPLDEAKFEVFCHKLCFKRITDDFEDYIRPFRNNINVIS